MNLNIDPSAAVGPGRCSVNDGGCWSQHKNGVKFSACKDNDLSGCHCPAGFTGDGKTCEGTFLFNTFTCFNLLKTLWVTIGVYL